MSAPIVDAAAAMVAQLLNQASRAPDLARHLESTTMSTNELQAGIGRKVARANAVAKLWPLLGFRLRDNLFG